MPTFCRHNHLIQNCPICSREQQIELRPMLSSSAPRSSLPRPSAPPGSRRGTSSTQRSARQGASSSGGLRVRKLARGIDDGFSSRLIPGLRSSADARRLAEELAYSAHRLAQLETDPPGLYAEVADPGGELEERTWLAFLIAYLCPLDEDDPFASIRAVRTSWASDAVPALDGVATGPRTAHDPARGTATLDAYRAWAARAGSQGAAFRGEGGWTPERRFARIYERLALPGLHRDARFDVLVTLGRLGLYELRAGALNLGGENDTTVAAKRALGIGDPMLLERRAAELAEACGVSLDALDLALYNWGRGTRATLGLGPHAGPELQQLAVISAAFGLDDAE
jgi:hypothetical protein